MWQVIQEKNSLKISGQDIGIQPDLEEIPIPPPTGRFDRFKRFLFGPPRPPRFHFILERPFQTDVLVDSAKILRPRDGGGYSEAYFKYKFVPRPSEKALKVMERAKLVKEEEE